jgi:hypothetical protein
MGVEQGGSYLDEAGEYGGGSDFTYGYGGGGDEYVVSNGGAYDFTGDYGSFDEYDFLGFGFEAGAGDSGYSAGGGNLFDAYTDFYTEAGFDLTTAMELAAQEVAAGSTKIITDEYGPLPDISNQPFYELPYVPDPFLTPYTPIFPEGPAPLPPVITPLIPLTVQPPPQTPLPQTPTTGPQPIAPGLPPACPTGQYHPYPIGHPQQNVCIPFPPAQVSKSPAPIPAGATGGSTSKSPTQQQKPPAQQTCPTGYCKHPTTGQCIPIPSGYARHPQTQVCTPAQQQQQKCPTGYYGPVNGQCLPIPKCTTPGTVFDQARGLCVPKDQAISPLPEPGGLDDLFGGLKEIPWWLWLAAAGLLLLSRDSDGKKTTVTYRRAR